MRNRILFVLALLVAAAVWFWWVPGFRLPPLPVPTTDPSGAAKLFEAIQAAEARLPLSPEGESRMFSHGRRTPRVFVLLHGLTNCPEQFVPLGRILFESGANVVIPRARYAGLANRLNNEQGRQSAQDLIDQAEEGLALATGLGDSITLVGLSGSAVAVGWMAQNRPGIDRAVLISPFFAPNGMPALAVDAIAPVLARLPPVFIWWNPELREANPGPPYAYPRVSTFTLADTLQLSRNVQAGVRTGPLEAGRVLFITSDADVAVDGPLNRALAAEWEKRFPGRVTFFEFPADQKVPHDMIDPNQPDQRTAIAYPKILQLLGVPVPAGIIR
ncbi:MAG: hypothetical protein SFU53_07635 [Terrimicrobiaceae bacterium]|nr:hypothetical protein [Terrimicrobiaceae bacterium]